MGPQRGCVALELNRVTAQGNSSETGSAWVQDGQLDDLTSNQAKEIRDPNGVRSGIGRKRICKYQGALGRAGEIGAVLGPLIVQGSQTSREAFELRSAVELNSLAARLEGERRGSVQITTKKSLDTRTLKN